MCVWLITNFRKMPRSQTDWLLVCNETFRVDIKRELTARVGVHAM